MEINKKDIAKEFRKNPTKSEQIMWNVLKNRNFSKLKFRRQHIIKGFIVDFYCAELKLAVEVDGEIHKYQIKDDFARQKIIESEKIIFFRLTNKEIENDIQNVLLKLRKFIDLHCHYLFMAKENKYIRFNASAK